MNGEVVLFADVITGSIRALIEITDYRRARQIAYNKEHGITPKSVVRAVQESLHVILKQAKDVEKSIIAETAPDFDLHELIQELERDMATAAANLEYERAALIRDQLAELRAGNGLDKITTLPKPVKYSGKGSRKGARK